MRIDNNMEQDVAIKMIRDIRPDNPFIRNQIHSEIESMVILSSSPECNPMVSCIYDYTLHNDNVTYIIMEYIKGIELREFREEYFIKVIEALAYIHSKEIIHSDIKSSNIMVSDEGDIKIVDLGVACIKQCRFIAGTLSYIDPLYFKHRITAHTYKSDIFACGLMFYYMITRAEKIEYNKLPAVDIISVYETQKINILNYFKKGIYEDNNDITQSDMIGNILIDMINPLDADKRPSANEILRMIS
jgi:serine/threonine protein kinase